MVKMNHAAPELRDVIHAFAYRFREKRKALAVIKKAVYPLTLEIVLIIDEIIIDALIA